MVTLTERLNVIRGNVDGVTETGVRVSHVYQMLALTEEFLDILEFEILSDEDIEVRDYIDLLHDHLLDYFIQVEDLDSTGKVSERIKNFVFVDKTS